MSRPAAASLVLTDEDCILLDRLSQKVSTSSSPVFVTLIIGLQARPHNPRRDSDSDSVFWNSSSHHGVRANYCACPNPRPL
jgi:hypothetical protein